MSAEMTCLEGGGEATRNFAAAAVVTVAVERSHVVFSRRRSGVEAECRIRVLGRLIIIQSRRRTSGLLIRIPCHWRGHRIVRSSTPTNWLRYTPVNDQAAWNHHVNLEAELYPTKFKYYQIALCALEVGGWHR